ncbi:carbohydrate ABC transporter permease [Dactylosporangium matsuzakiense]|uniref:carbohydrate ABC transporter permease n=1 Tax=Dactylosporangium matsuzakiense TaxID=53360 RepID=UPI0021C2BBD0|nr:carbohydrate ABC transporter permease [Dactylosporangium matsuzakiense]UWZ41036.1 carbohydrate ABC transporter permease [Dactylosporangium matsuzakiense]
MTRPIWQEPPTVAGRAGKGAVLTVVLLVLAVPLYSVVLTSLSDQAAINRAGGMVLLPDNLTLESYRQIFGNALIMHSLVISVVITLVGTLLSMLTTVTCAYGLSRRGSFAHRTLLMTLIVTMFFGGGIIPTFIVVSALGGYDNYWSLILPSAVYVFNIIVMRGFFMNTAPDLIDSARLDGANEWRVLWSVVVPVSKPVVAVITLFYAVGYWNSFFNALLYLPDNGKWPLQMIVYTYTLLGSPTPGTGITSGQLAGHQALAPLSIQMAVVTLTLIPILLVYPFVQRHFVKGMLIGAIKG